MTTSTRETLRLATTSSVEGSGLLELLAPAFGNTAGGMALEISPVGTGMALEMGRAGEADALIVHDQERELRFLDTGHGVNRREFMTNDFILVGPPDDPARVASAGNIYEALEIIHDHQVLFFNRADDSGTNLREIDLWAGMALLPFGRPWYKPARGGMAACLEAASTAGAYTLTDRGTYLSRAGSLKLRVLCEDSRHLRNPYSIIVINPAFHPRVRYQEAMALVAFLTGEAGQRLIRDFKRNGQSLFYPLWNPDGATPSMISATPEKTGSRP